MTIKLDQILISIDADTKPLKKSLQETEHYSLKKSKKIGEGVTKNLSPPIAHQILGSGSSYVQNELGKTLFSSGKNQQKAMNPVELWGDRTATKISKSILAKTLINPLAEVLKTSLFGGIFGRETGGKVASKKTYLVGEKGPELFVPDQHGRIINHPRTNQSNQTKSPVHVTINVQTPNADSFRRSQSQIMSSMHNAFLTRS